MLSLKKKQNAAHITLANTALSDLASYVGSCQFSVRALCKRGHVQAIVQAVLQLELMVQELSVGDENTCGVSDKSQQKSSQADN